MSVRQRDSVVLGSISEISVAISVKNVKENAYNARLIAIFPRQLTMLTSVSTIALSSMNIWQFKYLVD